MLGTQLGRCYPVRSVAKAGTLWKTVWLLDYTKRSSSRHIIIGFSKVNIEERMLKAARGKREVTYKGKPIRVSLDFSAEI